LTLEAEMFVFGDRVGKVTALFHGQITSYTNKLGQLRKIV